MPQTNSSNPIMRAKLRIDFIQKTKDEYGNVTGLYINMSAVGKSGSYPEDGSDENNTFAKWTPSASFHAYVCNPALFGSLSKGQEFYVDFTDSASPVIAPSPSNPPLGLPDLQIIQSKGWRKRLDEILQEMKGEQSCGERGDAARHLSLSITHLEYAIMRQGMRLKAINEANPGVQPNPYPTSYDPSTAKVEPTADGLKM